MVVMRQRYRTAPSGSGCRMMGVELDRASADPASGVALVVSAERHVEGLRLAVALEGDGDLVAWLVPGDERREVLRTTHRVPVEMGDHVAHLDAGLIRGRAGLHGHDNRARLAVGVRLRRDAEQRVLRHFALAQLVDQLARTIDRDREADILTLAGDC